MKRTKIKALYLKGKISPVDTSQVILLRDFRDGLKDGAVLWITYENYGSARREEHINFFWVCRDRYANGLLLDKEIARRQIERRWGVTYPWPLSEPPTRQGTFIEMDGEIHFHVSTKELFVTELSRMIDGTIEQCKDNSIDVEDLIKEREG